MEKDRRNVSLNKRLAMIAAAVFVPMIFALIYGMHAMTEATKTYTEITQSIIYANDSLDFKETMDYSAYLAVVRKEDFQELGVGEVTVNGIVTVNPYEAIEEMKDKCKKLSEMTSVEFLDENIYMLTTIVEEGIQDYIHTETAELQTVCELQEKHNARIRLLCILITALAIYAAAILTFRAFRSITEPVRRLCGLTEKVAEGDFKARSEGTDIREIQVLTDSFNNMTGEIGTLVDNIKEKEKNLHLMETRLLQEQINPHFLYNTLDAIVWLAEDNQKEDVIAMVTYLSNFFRTTLAQGKDFVSVHEESSHIESYLKIQGFRYQDIMEYEVDMEDNISDYMIPKLLLQPLVENALYHGVKKKRGKSRIFVWGYREGVNLVFKVSDNGKGMCKEVLSALRENIEKGVAQKENDSFGLANVNQRIKYYYGEEYGLEIESEENIGTEATIRLPAKKITPLS